METLGALALLGAVCLGALLAYAVPLGILLYKTRGSEIRLEGLRFVDRPVEPREELVRRAGRGPTLEDLRKAAHVTRKPDFFDQSRERGGDET